MRSATSSQTELRLVNVARASLDELLLDYEDFLRRGLPAWGKDDSQAREVRALGRNNPTDQSDQTNRPDERLCQACGKPMTLRKARQGTNAGAQFWGCSGYPECKSTQRPGTTITPAIINYTSSVTYLHNFCP